MARETEDKTRKENTYTDGAKYVCRSETTGLFGQAHS